MGALRDNVPGSPWYERLTVIGIVVFAHLTLFAFWLAQPEPPRVAVNEMSISFAQMNRQQADIVPLTETRPEIRPAPKPDRIEPGPEPDKIRPEAQQSVAEEPVEAAPPQVGQTMPSPVQLDTEPDYRAEYLNNPRPPYPRAARRMGYQGKVVLNVEVLAEGRAGGVELQSSSGYDILDNAAIQTVKTWKFAPARRFGRPVTQWFLVPIKYSLEDEA